MNFHVSFHPYLCRNSYRFSVKLDYRCNTRHLDSNSLVVEYLKNIVVSNLTIYLSNERARQRAPT